MATLFATGRHYGGEVFTAKLVLEHPWLASRMRALSVLDRSEKLVEKLNLFQPATLAGYPSALALMAGEQAAGRPHITPVLARTAGENLTEEIRSRISGGPGCRVIDSYASSEAPALGTDASTTGNTSTPTGTSWSPSRTTTPPLHRGSSRQPC